MRVLFLTTLLPGSKYTGSEVASQSFIDGLRAIGHDVTVIGYRRVGTNPPRHAQDLIAADRHIETRDAGLRPGLWMARAIAGRAPYTVTKFVSAAYRRCAQDVLARVRPQLVVLDHARTSWLLPEAGWATPHVYLAHNVEHRLYADLARGRPVLGWANRRESRRIHAVERRICAGAREVWTLTAEDATTLEGLGALTRHFHLPPTEVPSATPVAPTRDVVTLGSWTWKANAAGLQWLLDEVVPHLPAGVQIHVGGAGAQELTAGRPRVTYHGRVPDAMEFLRSGRVVAVPSVRGAGVQVKTIDALTTGRPVVATATAMRGVGDPPARTAVVSDCVSFAAALAGALAQPDIGSTEAAFAWAHARVESFHDSLRAATRTVAVS